MQHEVIDELESDATALNTQPQDHADAKAQQAQGDADGQACISFDGVDVVSPGGDNFAGKVSFKVAPGEGLMVTGRSASGKTSLV